MIQSVEAAVDASFGLRVGRRGDALIEYKIVNNGVDTQADELQRKDARGGASEGTVEPRPQQQQQQQQHCVDGSLAPSDLAPVDSHEELAPLSSILTYVEEW
eukprot:COSAG05_NODE_419_length_10002_cov_97.065031_3_plen_102_part_00